MGRHLERWKDQACHYGARSRCPKERIYRKKLSKQHLIDNAIISKLEGSDAPTDDNIAKISSSTARTVHRRQLNQIHFRITKAPSNGAGRARTITPNILAALRNELVDSPYMRLKDIIAFLRKEFNANVTHFSVSRALEA